MTDSYRRTQFETHAEATAELRKGEIVVDRGQYVWPQFAIITPPAVGDKVSYAFNGDYYPDGVITHVTKDTYKVVKTDTGSTYYRHKKGGSWIKKGGTWSMIAGHINRTNPEF